jgi:hypothetical protein
MKPCEVDRENCWAKFPGSQDCAEFDPRGCAAAERDAATASIEELEAASAILDRALSNPKNPIFSMVEGEHCPHYGFCGGKLRVHESTTDDNPVFVCDTVGHEFTKESFL